MAKRKTKKSMEINEGLGDTLADVGQIGLDVVGTIPGFEAADLANAAIYVARGNYLFAGLSLISAIPLIGDIIGKGGKMTVWLSKTFPKAAGQVAKYGPDVVSGVVKAKKAIADHRPQIMTLLRGIQEMSKKNPVAAQVVPHLPQIQQALDVFARSPIQQPQPGSVTAQPGMAAEGLFLPSMSEILFESHDFSGAAEKPANHVIDSGISPSEGQNLAAQLHLDFNEEQFGFDDFLDGANHEIEHAEVVHESPSMIAQIAVDHLKEDPDYYKKLVKIESLNLKKFYKGILV